MNPAALFDFFSPSMHKKKLFVHLFSFVHLSFPGRRRRRRRRHTPGGTHMREGAVTLASLVSTRSRNIVQSSRADRFIK